MLNPTALDCNALDPNALILAIDTSGRQGSVALLRAQGEQLVALGQSVISAGQCSELLLPSIADLLASHGLQKNSIALIAVASGPGSFTGLRVAIATVKGLAEAFAIPVVAVSVLEAIACASGAEGRVVAAIDAQRSEIFWGEYNLESAAQAAAHSATFDPRVAPTPKLPAMIREALAGLADFASRFASTPAPPQLFTSDAVLAARLHQAGVQAAVLAAPSAEDFARLAYRKFLAGVHADVAALDANYLRRSDAEIFSVPKPGSTSR